MGTIFLETMRVHIEMARDERHGKPNMKTLNGDQQYRTTPATHLQKTKTPLFSKFKYA